MIKTLVKAKRDPKAPWLLLEILPTLPATKLCSFQMSFMYPGNFKCILKVGRFEVFERVTDTTKEKDEFMNLLEANIYYTHWE